jgi:hypothetical protein
VDGEIVAGDQILLLGVTACVMEGLARFDDGHCREYVFGIGCLASEAGSHLAPVGVIGLRGIPANYLGFQQLALGIGRVRRIAENQSGNETGRAQCDLGNQFLCLLSHESRSQLC